MSGTGGTNRIASLATCAEITRREARNFYYGLRLLPPRQRLALYAVYAWMRVLDDIADDPGVAVEARRASLDRFEKATSTVLSGQVRWQESSEAQVVGGATSRETAVLAGLAYLMSEFPVDPADFLAAIEGQRMDLEPVVYAGAGAVDVYCDRVAATVGRICLDVWGVREGADAAQARALSTERGIAFQLVNILRDVREDHARGRCYLPADRLAAHGLAIDDLVAWRDAARCARFMDEQCARAERRFAASADLERLVSPPAVATLAAMSEIYRRILGRIARDPRAAMERRVRLPALEKSWIALRARFGFLGPKA